MFVCSCMRFVLSIANRALILLVQHHGEGTSQGSSLDWRMLNHGWYQADAVLTSGAILRAEPTIVYGPFYDDMVRARVAEGRGKYPLNCVISGSGQLPPQHPILTNPDVPCVVFTRY